MNMSFKLQIETLIPNKTNRYEVILLLIVSVLMYGCNELKSNPKIHVINDARVELMGTCAFQGHALATGECKKALNILDENGFIRGGEKGVCEGDFGDVGCVEYRK